MRLNLDLDYVVDEVADRRNPSFETNSRLSITLLRTAISAVRSPDRGGHKSRSEIRVAAKVVDAITRANNVKAASVEFTLLELLHVRDTLRSWMTEVGIPGALAGWFEVLYSAVEKLVEDGEKAEAAAKAPG